MPTTYNVLEFTKALGRLSTIPGDRQFYDALMSNLDDLNGYDRDEATQLQTEGDMEEIVKFILLNGFERFHRIERFIQHAVGFMQPEDLLLVPELKEISIKYPAMFRTMKIWAWG